MSKDSLAFQIKYAERHIKLNDDIILQNYINKRISLHNDGKGAKFTRGKKWEIIYQKRYKNKSQAMKEEYKLKNNRIKRNKLKAEFLIKYENFNTSTL